MPLFSIIMPSFLSHYKGSASNKEEKIIRAVKSVINQTFKDWELVIVADGCQKTVDIIRQNFTDERISLYKIVRQRQWSGKVRNAGIRKAKGEWICYLDIDDMLGTKHLEIISKNLKGDWVWFNDYTYTLQTKSFLEVHENIDIRGKCGTSTVCHRKSLNVRWPEDGGYLHDWYFINNLKKLSSDYSKIETPEYLICHLPDLLDV